MRYIYVHCVPTWKSIDWCTGVPGTIWVELLSTSFSETLWWKPSTTSLCARLYSKGWMKCPIQRALTNGIQAMCVTIVWPIQTTFPKIITHVSFTTILLNCILFLIQVSALWEHMSHAATKKFIDTNERVNSEVKSSDWWWNQWVHSSNVATATIILSPAIATAAAWSSHYSLFLNFWPDTSYKLFGW